MSECSPTCATTSKMSTTYDLLQCTDTDRLEILQTYNRTPDNIKKDVQAIKDWMQKQPHLPEVAEDAKIERFLIFNKASVERTKERLDMYYTMKNLVPEFYNKDPAGSRMQTMNDLVYFFPLPKLTAKKERVTLFKLRKTDATYFSGEDYSAYTFNITEVRILEDYLVSDIHVYDWRGYTMAHISKFSPALVKKATMVLERVFGNRVSAIYFLYPPIAVETIVSLLKRFLKPKLFNRVHVLSDFDSVFKILPREIFPQDLGGEERRLDELNELWMNKMVGMSDYYRKMAQLKVEEKLRPGKPLDVELQGLQGNFRKLDVD